MILVVFLAGYLSENRPLLMEQDTRVGPLRLPPLPYLAPMVAMWAIALLIVVVQRDLGAALLFFGVFLALALRRDRPGQPRRHRARPVRPRQPADGDALRPRPDPHRHLARPVRRPARRRATRSSRRSTRSPAAACSASGSGPGCPRSAAACRSRRSTRTSRSPRSARSSASSGSWPILGLYLVVVERGLRIGAAAADDFRALLAVGLSLVIGIQAFIIAAGNLKVLPLTGVTLPFISYGGSSLLANAVVIGLLLALSDKGVEPPPPPTAAPALARLRRARAHDAGASRPAAARSAAAIVHVAVVLSLAFGTLAGGRSATGGSSARPSSRRSPYDPAVIAAARTVPRGRILDRDGKVLARNEKDSNGEYYRVYAGDAISHVVGYASRRYGRAGLERAYDAELAGLAGDPLADALRKFGATPYDPQTLTLSLSLRPPAGGRPRARRRTRAPS